MIISRCSFDSLDVDMFCIRLAKINTFVAFEDPIFVLLHIVNGLGKQADVKKGCLLYVKTSLILKGLCCPLRLLWRNCDLGKRVCKDKWVNVESLVSTSEHRKNKTENMH